jgi:16S rRNA (guanine527-N7)-methyltransferase
MSDGAVGDIGPRLNRMLAESCQAELDSLTAARFEAFLRLLVRWNARTNLTAIRDEEGILRRHFLESIACARVLPEGIKTLLDFGSGAGFPGIPVALCRPEMDVTLAESQGKKAAFLREAVRTLGIGAHVHGARAQTLGRFFDCVTLRAVDQMGEALVASRDMIADGGWFAPLTTVGECAQIKELAGPGFAWLEPERLPGGNDRVVLLGRRAE